MTDVNFCPHCGTEDPITRFDEDMMLNRPYTDIRCPECDAQLRAYRMGTWDSDVDATNKNDIRTPLKGDFFVQPIGQLAQELRRQEREDALYDSVVVDEPTGEPDEEEDDE